mmetsp:Transcript_15156/g.39394  ORF Transcript_15156/g.39394 Transcript_15156/m.39394 type:complete len:204 (+) Transcript_15156:161-772(+)
MSSTSRSPSVASACVSSTSCGCATSPLLVGWLDGSGAGATRALALCPALAAGVGPELTTRGLPSLEALGRPEKWKERGLVRRVMRASTDWFTGHSNRCSPCSAATSENARPRVSSTTDEAPSSYARQHGSRWYGRRVKAPHRQRLRTTTSCEEAGGGLVGICVIAIICTTSDAPTSHGINSRNRSDTSSPSAGECLDVIRSST